MEVTEGCSEVRRDIPRNELFLVSIQLDILGSSTERSTFGAGKVSCSMCEMLGEEVLRSSFSGGGRRNFLGLAQAEEGRLADVDVPWRKAQAT